MKNLYSISILILLFFSVSVLGQIRIYPPTLRAPINEDIDQSPDVNLDWDAVTGQTTNITYEVQLATNADFSNALTFPPTDLTAMNMSELMFGSVYYWHVKAYDDDEPSDWSETWSFTVIDKLEFTALPKTGQLVYATQLVKWDETTGITKYQLQVDTTYTWQLAPTITSKTIQGSFIFPDGKKWVVGEEGLIMHFDGNEWMSYDVEESIDFNDVSFVDESTGYAVGDDQILYIYDGTSWSPMELEFSGDYYDVRFVDANTGWIVGEDGLIISYLDGAWTTDTAFIDEEAVGTDFLAVYPLSANSVWACGKGKTIAYFDGTAWNAEIVGAKDYNDISFIDENNGFAVGKSGSIVQFDGSTWAEVEGLTNEELFAVAFSGDFGYAVGNKGVSLQYMGGTWELIPPIVEYKLYSMFAQDDMKFITGGEQGIIVSYEGEAFNSPYTRFYNIAPDSSSYQFNNLHFGEPYYYRVRAMHNQDTSSWSNVKSLRTFAKPTLREPDDNESDTDLFLVFLWEDYKGASDYVFEISFTEDFSIPVSSFSDSTSTSYQMKYYGRDYYWRVKALHAADDSDWSDVRTLTTVNDVTLISPENEAVDVQSCPKYDWAEIIGAGGYELWLDSDPDFSDPTKGMTELPSYQCSSPLEKKTMYYWKVRSLTSLDTSSWSPVWSFEVEGYAGIGDEFNNGSIDIYPNPSDGVFNLMINSYANEVYDISVVDITGKLVHKENINCSSGINNTTLSLTSLQKGLYFVNVRKKDKMVTKKLFIK